MTRTEAIIAALAAELKRLGPELNSRGDLRAISFDIKLIPGTTVIRAVVTRPEFEWTGDDRRKVQRERIG